MVRGQPEFLISLEVSLFHHTLSDLVTMLYTRSDARLLGAYSLSPLSTRFRNDSTRLMTFDLLQFSTTAVTRAIDMSSTLFRGAISSPRPYPVHDKNLFKVAPRSTLTHSVSRSTSSSRLESRPLRGCAMCGRARFELRESTRDPSRVDRTGRFERIQEFSERY
jgi:hypothetical protein